MRFTVARLLFAIAGTLAAQEAHEGAAVAQVHSVLDGYFNIASGKRATEFRPMTFPERRSLFLHSLVNPLSLGQPVLSAGLDHLNDKPVEWEQGISGYAKRFGNIMGQSLTRRTVEFGTSSLLHEDNRYFGSGQHGAWKRTQYAVISSVTARHDNGRRYPSISTITSVAAGAGIARLWLPSSQSRFSNAAASFGYTMAGRVGTSVLKEFLPDLLRPFAKNRHAPATPPPSGNN
jgi:hypothetical protein